MRRALPLLLLALAVLAGCKTPPPHDQALVDDLRGAIAACLVEMGEAPLSERALADEAMRLANACDRARIAALREGTLAPEALAAAARGVAKRIEAARPGVRPPRILSHLAAKPPASLSPPQRLLLSAIADQAEAELPKPKSAP